jgi:hypothetical protein
MAAEQLSVRQRVEACMYLELMAIELNKLSVALARYGLETEADMTDSAAKSALACHAAEHRHPGALASNPPACARDRPAGDPQGLFGRRSHRRRGPRRVDNQPRRGADRAASAERRMASCSCSTSRRG